MFPGYEEEAAGGRQEALTATVSGNKLITSEINWTGIRSLGNKAVSALTWSDWINSSHTRSDIGFLQAGEAAELV